MVERCKQEGHAEEALWKKIRRGWKFGADDFLEPLNAGVPQTLWMALRATSVKSFNTRDCPPACTEMLTRLVSTPHQIRVYDLPSLLAGKFYGVLCRNWTNRAKGRDFYDLIWYVGRRVPPNLGHIKARMRQSRD
jgi:hypothetical protein